MNSFRTPTPSHPFGATRRLLAVATLALPLPVAQAQEVEDAYPTELDLPSQSRFAGQGGFGWQGKADIDGGGTMQVSRYDAAVAFEASLTKKLSWANVFFVGLNDYDFEGGGFSAGNPWDSILATRLGTQLTYEIDEHWGVRGGGVFMFSQETGANWGEGFMGGGVVGVNYRHSKTLFVTMGLALVSQIEDDAKISPSIGVNWLPSEHWTVRAGAIPVSGGIGGAAEVEYQLSEQWMAGFGMFYNHRRFRLDDSGVAPDGVGQEQTLPLLLRLGWRVTPQVSLNILGGVVLGGQLELDDRIGNTLRKQDYDPAAYFGVRAIGRF